MPAVHDRGGLPTDEPIDRAEHEWADWEHVTNALVGVLRRHGLINVDELRRGIEAMAPAEYESVQLLRTLVGVHRDPSRREGHPEPS